VVAGDDGAACQGSQVEVADVARQALRHRQVEHLVEVAVVQRAVPSHRQRGAAHDGVRRGRVEGTGEPVHVARIVAAVEQELEKTADGHVGDGEQTVEHHAVAVIQFATKARLQAVLRRWQEGAHGVVDQIEHQAAARVAVA
jgi:hypothetical protein